MKSGILKTLEEITGEKGCIELIIDIGTHIHYYRCQYNTLKRYIANCRVKLTMEYFKDFCMVKVNDELHLYPLSWFKDIQEVKEPTDWTKVE